MHLAAVTAKTSRALMSSLSSGSPGMQQQQQQHCARRLGATRTACRTAARKGVAVKDTRQVADEYAGREGGDDDDDDDDVAVEIVESSGLPKAALLCSCFWICRDKALGDSSLFVSLGRHV